jgi:hypothetical protein
MSGSWGDETYRKNVVAPVDTLGALGRAVGSQRIDVNTLIGDLKLQP